MIGQSVSHYQILERLGQGGMGVVYKAQDTKLDRSVALKFLSTSALPTDDDKARFVREAKAAAKLNHPHIATVYEIDETDDGQGFIAMEYVEGETLSEKIKAGPLKLQEAITIATQVAEGLQAAHEQGIVHRDVKASNVMLTERGVVKILDFGLAKLSGSVDLTKTGSTVGTVSYMSPEQARGETVDHRTDVWSLGVVLYEMLTGERPFRGDYEQAVIYSILNVDPKPVTTLRPKAPEALGRVLARSLAKDAAARYTDTSALLSDLHTLQRQMASKAPAPEEKSVPSIAVLPFANMSADPEQEYFCDGMAEEIIGALTQVRDLRVVARTSAFSFKGQHVDIREIGQKLCVEAVLEGSVRKAGNRLRITAQLINVADGYHLWSQRYDRVLEDVFEIQDEISLMVVEQLKIELLGEDETKLTKEHTQNLEAYDLYLQGRYFWNKRTSEGMEQALTYFNQSIAKDPHYAPAYAGLSATYVLIGFGYGSSPPKEAWRKAKAAALKALALDETLSEAHTSLGYVKMVTEWDFPGAEQAFQRAIELNPGYALAHQWYGQVWMARGQYDKSLAALQRALALDPLSLVLNTEVAWPLTYARRDEEAMAQYRKVLKMDPGFALARYGLALGYMHKGMYEEAIRELQEAVGQSGGMTFTKSGLGYVYAVMGRREEALKMLNELLDLSIQGYLVAVNVAEIYIGLGETTAALDWLEKGYEERHGLMFVLKTYIPDLLRSDLLDGDPRYEALLEKMGLA